MSEGARLFRHLGTARALWPDPLEGPYVAYTYWTNVDGNLECVGLGLSSFDDLGGDDDPRPVGDRLAPVSPGQLREVPWRQLMDGYREQAHIDAVLLGLSAAEREELSARLRDKGIDPRRAGVRDWISLLSKERQEQAIARQPVDPRPGPRPRARGGRPPTYTEDEWRARALVYLAAAGAGLPPNRVLADQYRVEISTARNWAATLRKKGLLPPTTAGRPSRRPKEEP